MWRTYVFFINICVLSVSVSVRAQDTIDFPLKVRAGFDVSGPVIYFTDRNNMSLEGYISVDRNEKMAITVEGGYLKYNYSQYNYDFKSTGIFIRAGVDFNLLRPNISAGKYHAGLGLHYGLSLFSPETSSFRHENYWGNVTSAIPSKTSTGHFLEAAPGIRAELFRNFSIGWTIRLRLLLSGGGGKDLRPIYFPGFGFGDKTVNAGFNYYLTWSFPFKTKTVITRPPPPEEPEEEEVNQAGTEIRQSAIRYQ